MDKINEIYQGLKAFIHTFIIKYEYENRGMLKKMRIDSRLNMDIDNEKWCKLFLCKSCFNHCAKFVLLRYLEDCGLSYGKMNLKGLKKWKDFVKNISEKLNLLYAIVIKDLQEDENNKIRKIFKESDYDVFEIDEELARGMSEHLSFIDFSSLKKKDIVLLFRRIYSLEQREEMKLDEFYKDAPALSYILQLEKTEELL
ncbi:MAG: hypothetical protein N4A62_17500 [Marinisporobacter sp.]|nr:hypothetical protein [Marinisporobacter sp.]